MSRAGRLPDRTTSGQTRPVGTVTRGTTTPNRLRRMDRWLIGPVGERLRTAPDPLVVDLGYGASGITSWELRERLRSVRPDVEVIGIEIDSARVAAAAHLSDASLSFRRGGFELSLPDGRRPIMIRAANVLRQYQETDVQGAWDLLRSRLAPRGLLLEGTCDEIGRRATWVSLDGSGPVSLTLSTRLAGLTQPSELAERLPKALIHHNVPGTRIHTFLSAMDLAWDRHAPLATFGARQRWTAMCESLRHNGFTVLNDKSRWRLGELSVAWDDVRVD